MKLAISSTDIDLPIFIMPFYYISRIFSESRSFRLNTNNPQIHLIFLIIFHIQCKTSIFTNSHMIDHIFFRALLFYLMFVFVWMLVWMMLFMFFVFLSIMLGLLFGWGFMMLVMLGLGLGIEALLLFFWGLW